MDLVEFEETGAVDAAVALLFDELHRGTQVVELAILGAPGTVFVDDDVRHQWLLDSETDSSPVGVSTTLLEDFAPARLGRPTHPAAIARAVRVW